MASCYIGRRLQQRITLQRPVETSDAIGQTETEWVTVGVIWADVRPNGAGKQFQADQVSKVQPEYYVWIRHRSDIKADWRILWGAIALEQVAEPVDYRAGHRWLELLCRANTALVRTESPYNPAALAGTARTRAELDTELTALRASLGTQTSILTFLQPGETLAADGLAVMTRVAASGLSAVMLPSGLTVVLPASVTLTGMTLYGGGELLYTGGNLRIGSACTLLDLRIRGAGRTNAGTGVSVLADSAGVLIAGCDIAEVAYTGVNINQRTRDIRVLRNRISDTGGGTFDPTWQAAGVYAGTCTNLDIHGNDIDNTRGQGAIHLNGCANWRVDRNVAEDTHWRGVNCTGANTEGRIRSNAVRRAGSVNPGDSAVGCNGYFVNETASPWDVLVVDNDAEFCGENLYEGRAAWINNRGHHSGAYPALSSPSKEGIYLVAGGVAIGNHVADTVGAGLYCYSGPGSHDGPMVRGNTIARAGGSGLRVLADGGRLNNTLVRDNVVSGGDPLLQGYELATTAGGSYGPTTVTGNTLAGRTLNTIPATAEQRGNSWQTTS